MSLPSKTDLPVIIGAGPGGTATALFLAKEGQASIVLDRATFPRDKICGDALSGKVVEVLNKLDKALVPAFHAKTELQVPSWGILFVAPSGRELRVPFRTGPQAGALPPGFISTRLDFDNWMLEQAQQASGVTIAQRTEVEKLEKTPYGYRLHTNTGSIETPLVIGCDGAQGHTGRLLGHIEKEDAHYCAAVRAYYNNVKGMDSENFIELHFLPDLLPGYLWIFPLPNGRANVGLGMRTDVVAKRKVNLRTLLPEVLSRSPFCERFAHAELDGAIRGFGLPLGSKQRKISGDNFLLVGDAASLIDPFTGEGIGNAMISGMFAAQKGIEALKTQKLTSADLAPYDKLVYDRLWPELRLSRTLQNLSTQQWLFNWVVEKARRSPTLRETISCMFEDIDLRDKLRDPRFYFHLMFE
jgi:menaquinone-9 beta-reductase